MLKPLLLGVVALTFVGCFGFDFLGVEVLRAEGEYRVIDPSDIVGYYLVGPVPRESTSDDNIEHLGGDPFWGFEIDSLGQRDGWIVAGRGDE